MKDPSYFWHIPDPTKYWYKGKSVTREIGTQRWITQPDHHDTDHPPMVFEWEFANDSWTFMDGAGVGIRVEITFFSDIVEDLKFYTPVYCQVKNS